MSDWIGPTWAQWASTVNRVNDAYDDLETAQKAARDWKKYAIRLEKELDEVWDLYREAQGNSAGQKTVKEVAVSEIEKLDPGNKMLDKAHRQAIFDKAKAEQQQAIDKRQGKI